MTAMSMTLAQQAADPNGSYLIFGALLMGGAFVLLFIELFVPSGGLIGILAGIAAIGSIVCFFLYDQTVGFISLGLTVVLGPVLITLMFKFWLNSAMGRGIILGGDASPSTEESFHASEYARQQRAAALRQLIGAEGKTMTACRPIGVVRINDERLDALAETGVIDANVTVVVTEVYDNQVKVRPVS